MSIAVEAVCAPRPVARVQLFGSRTTGQAHPGSDIDLLIEFLPGTPIGLLEMGSLKEDLEQRLGCTVGAVSRAAAAS